MNEDYDEPPDDESYEVGYGKPPWHSRFKPGQSGNPKGKVKGYKGYSATAKAVLNEKIKVQTAHGTRKMTKLEAMMRTLINAALQGDPKALDQALRIARDAGMGDEVAEALKSSVMLELREEDLAIVNRMRSAGQTSDGPKNVE